MQDTTLCYIEQDGKYLMLLRNKKENDVNEGKYIGVGGKFEPGETAEQCLLREVREETGFLLTEYEFRGIVHFRNDAWEDEEMYLYSAAGFDVSDPSMVESYQDGLPVPHCNEGTFEWVPMDRIGTLRTWEGDRYFLDAMAAGKRGIDLTLVYQGDDLVDVF